MDKETFVTMVKSHDLTYMYSDDGYVRGKGHDSLMQIRAAAKLLPEEFVKETWNAKVDRVLGEGFRKEFYW